MENRPNSVELLCGLLLLAAAAAYAMVALLRVPPEMAGCLFWAFFLGILAGGLINALQNR